MFKVTIEANGEIYKGKGKTINEALESVEISYTLIKTKGFLVIEDGKYQLRKFYVNRQLRRLLVSHLFRKQQILFAERLLEVMKKKKEYKREILTI